MKRQVIGMKERINRLAKGIIDSEQPKMTWSPEKIDETLRMNTLMQRNLWIGSENASWWNSTRRTEVATSLS